VFQEEGFNKTNGLRYWDSIANTTRTIQANEQMARAIRTKVDTIKLVTGPPETGNFAVIAGNEVYYYSSVSSAPKKMSLSITRNKASGLFSLSKDKLAGYFGQLGVIGHEQDRDEKKIGNKLHILDIDTGAEKVVKTDKAFLPRELAIYDDVLAVSTDSSFTFYDVSKDAIEAVFKSSGLRSLTVYGERIYGQNDSSIYAYDPAANTARLVFRSKLRLSHINTGGSKLYFSGFYGRGLDQKLYGFELGAQNVNDQATDVALLGYRRSDSTEVLVIRLQKKTIIATLPLRSLRARNGKIVYDEKELETERNKLFADIRKLGLNPNAYTYRYNLSTRSKTSGSEL